jgi:hypothetical protein
MVFCERRVAQQPPRAARLPVRVFTLRCLGIQKSYTRSERPHARHCHHGVAAVARTPPLAAHLHGPVVVLEGQNSPTDQRRQTSWRGPLGTHTQITRRGERVAQPPWERLSRGYRVRTGSLCSSQEKHHLWSRLAKQLLAPRASHGVAGGSQPGPPGGTSGRQRACADKTHREEKDLLHYTGPPWTPIT